MKKWSKIFMVATVFDISLIAIRAKAIIALDPGRKTVETQCNPLRANECGPVAYSNNCIGGGTNCSDRGCPSGSSEGYVYP